VSKYQIYSRILRTEKSVEGLCEGRGNGYKAKRKSVKNINNQLLVLFQIQQSLLPSQYMTVCVVLCWRPVHDVISACVSTERFRSFVSDIYSGMGITRTFVVWLLESGNW